MIKGISKQIIEIKCPNNEYFEKVLLFVNSKATTASEEILRKQAKNLSQKITQENVPPVFDKKINGVKNKRGTRNIFLISVVISSILILIAFFAFAVILI